MTTPARTLGAITRLGVALLLTGVGGASADAPGDPLVAFPAASAGPDTSAVLGQTAVHRAVLLTPDDRSLGELARLAEAGDDVNAADAAGNTPLHLAALMASPAVVRRLASLGADLDRAGADGATPLLLAVEAGRAGVVEEMLGAGADATVRDARGRTAQTLAAVSADPRIRDAFRGGAPGPGGGEIERLTATLFASERPAGVTVEATIVQLAGLGPETVPPVVAVLQDTARSHAQRALAAHVLGRLGRQEAVAPLLAVLYEKPHPRVARPAAEALAALAPAGQVVELCRYLRDVNPMDEQVRWGIYDALGAGGNPEALPFLFAAAREEVHPGCRDRALVAVDRIVGPVGARSLDERMQWIRRNRPGWLRHFNEQTVTHSGYRNIAWFFAAGAVLSVIVVWLLWRNF
jgi:hypothetical protein